MKITYSILLLLFSGSVFGAVPMVSPALGNTLEQVQLAINAENWGDAVDALNAFKGERNAVWYNTLGQLYLAQGKAGDAEEPLREAYSRNPDEQYGLNLAICLMQLKRNDEALALYGKNLNPSECDQHALESYLSLAVQMNDTRLMEELVAFGLIRFPDSEYLRAMDLRIAVDSGDESDILKASDWPLSKEPLNARWWQNRAAGSEQLSDLQLARLEAAVLAAPEEMKLRRQHMGAQLSAGHKREALKQAEVLMQNSPDNQTALICVQVAVLNEDYDLANTWISSVESKNDALFWRVSVVISIHRKDFAEADKALASLMKFPDPDADLWRWASNQVLNENLPLAEQWLQQGMMLDTQMETPIALDYARLLIELGRPQEAGDVVETYLEKHPSDAYAEALLKLTSE